MSRTEQLVIEAARQLVAAAARHPEMDSDDPVELKARLIALSWAVRALDGDERGD